MTLTARGRQVARALRPAAPERRRLADIRRGVPWALSAAVVAMAAGGCMTAQPVPQPRVPLIPYPTTVGMQQLRSGDGTYFVPCNPCAAPTPKTLVSGAEGTRDAPPSLLAAQASRTENFPAQVAAAPPPSPVWPAASSVASAAAPEVTKLSIQFAFGEILISRSDRAALERLAPVAQRSSSVSLKGGADSVGNASANEVIAKARTSAVQSELQRLGVPATRIRASHCATCFVAPNDSADGRKRNRRVDIEIAAASPKEGV